MKILKITLLQHDLKVKGTWLAQPYIEGHYDPAGGVTIEGGHIALPIGPGLGVTPDPAAFTREVCTL